MARSFLVSLLFVLGLSLSSAHAQFSVGGVTGGAPTAGVNCYGDADGKIAAYGEGWTPQDCGVYALYCSVQQFPCLAANQNFVCNDPATCTAQTTPSFASISCGDARVGVAYSCNAGTATVGNGEMISYSFSGAPAWLNINSATGVMTGTPGALDHPDIAGLTVTATAGSVAANAAALNIAVNKAPYYASPTCSPAVSGTAYTCSLAAIDDDAGDTLSYAMAGAPAWLSIDAATGIISGTPTGSADVGGLTVTATDASSLTANTGSISFVLNQAPAIVSFSCGNGTEGTAYSCLVPATDDDNDVITYSVANGPPWMTINSATGVLSGTPGTTGTFSNITVTATDGALQTTSSAFSVLVNPNVGGVLADTASTFSASDVADLATVGVDSAITDDLTNNNTCGSGGDQNCLEAFNDQKAFSSCALVGGSSATASQLTSYISCVMVEHHTASVASVALGGSSNITTGCSASVNLPIPSTCGHPQWSCSLQTGPSEWTISGLNLVVPADYSSSGSQTATIRMSLGIYSPAYTKDVTKTYNVAAAQAGATNGVKLFNNGASENLSSAQNTCRAKGGRLATNAEFTTVSSQGQRLFHWSAADPDVTTGSQCSKIPARNSCTPGNTCKHPLGSEYNQIQRWNGTWNCEGVGSSQTWYYACADLPSCN